VSMCGGLGRARSADFHGLERKGSLAHARIKRTRGGISKKLDAGGSTGQEGCSIAWIATTSRVRWVFETY